MTVNQITEYIYDVETYPDFFCVTFDDYETRERFVFQVSYFLDERKQLRKFLSRRDILLTGFNNLYYDGAILNYVLKNATIHLDVFFAELYDLSSRLVSDNFRFDEDIREYQNSVTFEQMDLMKVMAFDKLGVGLKQVAINLRHHRIQELPIPHDHSPMTQEETQIVLDYNGNDVDITTNFRYEITEQIELRTDLSKMYGVSLMNASDSKMANLILEDIYKRKFGAMELSRIQSLRTTRETVVLGDVIAPNIQFKTNIFKNLLVRISNTVVREEQKFKYKGSVTFGGVTFVMGVGGLHSADKAAIFETDEYFLVRDADIASMYPNIMINNNIVPEHLGQDFIDILRQITRERLEAKRAKNMVKANGLKITINSIFGKLNSKTFWLQDPKAMLSVTVSGQLYILMLIERLIIAGIPVVSANTDGIVCLIPREKEEIYYAVCKEWEKDTNFELEYTDYSKYARADVNNYITIKTDGKTKEKGRFVEEVALNKGYRHPIVPKALKKYFTSGVSVEDTIYSCRDILDFCISQKTGAKFVTRLLDEETGEVEYLQKNNRFFISLAGKKLQKIDKIRGVVVEMVDDYELDDSDEIVRPTVEKGVYGLFVEKRVSVLNNYDEDTLFEEYDVDFQFYIDEAHKYLDPILNSVKNQVPDIAFQDEELVEFKVDELQMLVDKISLKLRGVKNISTSTLQKLVEIESKKNEQPLNFDEFLIWSIENDYVAKKWEDLILIGYFDYFGVSRQKMYIAFQNIREGEFKYSKTLKEKTKLERVEKFKAFYSSIEDVEYNDVDIVNMEVGIAGRIVTVFPKSTLMYVEGVDVRYSPKLKLHSLRTGKTGEMKISKDKWQISGKKIGVGDIIKVVGFTKKPGGRFVENEETGEKEWVKDESIIVLWMDDWEIISKGN